MATLLFTCFHTETEAAQAQAPAIAPVYRIDVRSVVKGPFVFEPIGHPESRVGLPIRWLWFLDNQRLAVTVVTQPTERPTLQARGEPGPDSPFRLDVVLIEAATGKTLSVPVWPSNSRYAGIIAVNDRGFVTQRGDELTLLSPDLQPIKRMALPPLPADQYGHDNDWVPHSSWSGRRLLLLGGRVWEKGPWLWLDAENLQVLRSWNDFLMLPIAASDRELVMEAGGQHFGDPPPTLVISTPGEKWKPLLSTVDPSIPQFVGPGLLYFQRSGTNDPTKPPGVFLLHTDTGEMSRLEPPRRGWAFGRAATSRVGNRFVILVGQTKGSHPALDISGHTVLRSLLVYDPPFITPPSTLDVQGSRIRNPDLVALSPDGRHLAVFAYPDPVLEVFDLPPVDPPALR